MVVLYIILAIFVLVVLSLLYMRFEAGFVEFRKIRFTKSVNALKIMQLSDIHIKNLKVPVEKVNFYIEQEKPDIILLTGDYVQKPGNTEKFIEFLHNLKGDNIYFCLGNHDYEAFGNDDKGLDSFVKSMEETGAIGLLNRSVTYSKNSRKYNIIGIEECRTGHHNIESALKSIDSGAHANIAFSHNPDIILQLPHGSVDYLFCGHFHGGQVWTPFNLEFKLLRGDKLCKMGYKRGLHKLNNINLYINRGLGNVLVPLRFLSRPEITLFYVP